MQRVALLIFLVGGCGGGDGNKMPDAPSVSSMITVTGTATKRELTTMSAAAGATIGAYKNGSDATPVVTTTSDASGNYTLVIPTNGQPLDGYIKATLTGFVDTYLYPAKPLTMDFSGASINMATQQTLDALFPFCQTSQDSSKTIVAALVADAGMTAVADAMVTSTPAAGKYCYQAGSYPSGGATMTDANGIVYMLNVPAGSVTVTASKPGSTFGSHAVMARASTLTTTLIQP